MALYSKIYIYPKSYITIPLENGFKCVKIYIDINDFTTETRKIYINMSKIKKSITLSKDVYEMLSQISKKLEITENSVISIAILEYYNKVRGAL